MKWQDYFSSDNQVLLGKPTIKETIISVELILELLSNGWTEAKNLTSYPALSPESIKAVFAYLKTCIQQEMVYPIST